MILLPVRGTRNLVGLQAERLCVTARILEGLAMQDGYQRFLPSALAPRELFHGQVGDNLMWEFKDRGNRDVVLIPEVTAIVRQEYRDEWSKSLPRPVKIFYTTRCYRYERPQANRYREFWQFGVEYLGGKAPEDREQVLDLLKCALHSVPQVTMNDNVKRGLGYYVEDGFEASLESLGAQKQIAGGGRYPEGIGWALGIERLIAAQDSLSAP